MPLAPVIGFSQPPASHPFSLFVDGRDVLGTSATPGGVELDSIRIEEVGANATGSMAFTVDDPTRAYVLGAAAEVVFWDWGQNTALFAGPISNRHLEPAYAGQGQITGVTASDWGALLDERVVPGDRFPGGWPDQVIIQHLIGLYGGPITATSATVASTNASMPAMTFPPGTLRSAIEQVAAAAGAGRIYYLDSSRRLHYATNEALVAPYAVTDSLTPAGGEVAANILSLELEDRGSLDAAYVVGSNADGTGWVRSGTRTLPYERQEVLSNIDSDTVAKRNLYGAAFLARTATTVAGSFTVTGYDGWKAGQVVTITNTGLGMVAATAVIKSVSTRFLTGTGKREYTIAFGELPRSMARLVGKGPGNTGAGGISPWT